MYISVALIIPIFCLVLNMIIVHNCPFIILWIPWVWSDLLLNCPLQTHIFLKIVKIITVTILLRINYINPEQKGFDNMISLCTWTQRLQIILISSFNVLIFKLLLNFIEENVIIKVTKSTRGFRVNAFGRISRTKKSQIGADDVSSYLETPGSPSILTNSSCGSKSISNITCTHPYFHLLLSIIIVVSHNLYSTFKAKIRWFLT